MSVTQWFYAEGASFSGFVNGYNRFAILYGALNMTFMRAFSDQLRFASNFTGTVRDYTPFRPDVAMFSGASATITNYMPFYGPTTGTGVIYTNARHHRCDGTGGGSTVNTCFSTTERTGGLNNGAYHIDSNAATCGAGLVAGTAFDVCLYRGRAGAWTGPAGTDIYTDSGYICAGPTCSSVTSTNQGVYDSGVRVMHSVSCTGATCALTNGALSIAVTGTAGVTSLAGTAGQISTSASTGAVTLSLPNPIQPAQSAPSLASLGGAAGTGGGASISNIVGNNNAFFFDLTTGSAPISAGGIIATFTWSSSWNVALNPNGPACTAHIVNAEGVADPAGYMTTYGPKLYAIPTSGSVATSLDFKLATGASAVALPVATTVKMLIRCDMAR